MSILSFDNIKIETPYKLLSILDIKFEHGINMHSTLIIEAICEEDSFESFYKTTLDDFIKLTVNEQVVFNGLIGSYDANREGNLYSVTITGISATCLLDSKVESKSFQDTSMKYWDLVKEVINYIEDAAVSFNLENKEIKEPIIWYNETSWEFLKRMASHFNSVLICDIKEKKPRFYFGFKRIGEIEIPDTSFYTAKKDLKSLNLSTEKLIDTDFFCHEIKTKDVYQLQNEVSFKNKKLYISDIKGEFIKGELIFTYKLSRINGIRQNKIYNENIKGASLEGKVLDTKEELVKLHLNIDAKQDKDKAHWFKVGHLANNVFYLMFEKNTDARLYFPSNKEIEAEVKNSVRKNGDKCILTKEPKNRYLTTKDKNQMSLKPSSIEFKSNENLDLSILMEDKKGAKFISNQDINLNSKANISFNAKGSVKIKAQDFVLIQKYDELEPQSITIENEFHFLGSKISLNGRDRKAFRMFNDDPALLEIKKKKKELKTNPRLLNMNNQMSNQGMNAPNNLNSNNPLTMGQNNPLNSSGNNNALAKSNNQMSAPKTKAGAKSGFNKSAVFKTALLGFTLLAAAPVFAVVAAVVVTASLAFGASLAASAPKLASPKNLKSKNGENEFDLEDGIKDVLVEVIELSGCFTGAIKNVRLKKPTNEELMLRYEKEICKLNSKEELFKYMAENDSWEKNKTMIKSATKELFTFKEPTEEEILFSRRDEIRNLNSKQALIKYMAENGRWEENKKAMEVGGKQVFFGHYAEESNALGTVLQIGGGFTGLDVAADIRDLSYDIIHWEWTLEHAGQTALDGIGLLPVVGAIKYTDEALSLFKHADEVVETTEILAKNGDELLKHSDDIIETANDIAKNTDEVADISNDISKNIDETDDIIQDAVGAEKAIDNPNSNKKVVNGNDEFVDNSNKVNKPEKVAEKVTEGTRKVNFKSGVNGVEDHLKNVKKFKRDASKGITGGHNMDEFYNYFRDVEKLDDADFIHKVTNHPIIDGISQIEYKIPKIDNKGNFMGEYKYFKNPKTVYDPSKISDATIIEWGKAAMQQGIDAGNVVGRKITGIAPNGLKFEGYIDAEGIITNFYPKIN